MPSVFITWLRACVCTTSFTVGYNGAINGYFKGTRGLRQGDPLSPYLFVIALNNLSLMLKKVIFVDGNIESVQAVLQVLREFELRSGLAVSVHKTTFFASGLTADEANTIQFSTGMPLGSLPVRYLGVPLVTKKLTLLNCEVLLQQIKSKFSSWSSKSLSFAGRLLLIKTVIAGINTFWCSTFILPKACVNRINSLCGVFLWKGNVESHHTARVSWAVVTKPKEEGGLGIKDLSTWNKACCLKLIWLLFFQSGSIWVAWFVAEVLQGNLSNLWTTMPNRRFSWQVNKLLKLSPLLYQWIKLRVSNGINCRFWTDNWSSLGSMRQYLQLGNTSLGISEQATLATLYTNGGWQMPPARSETQVQVHAILTTLHLRIHEASVPWHQTVWNKGGIPRHSFLSWLLVLNRCPTRDRIIGWGLPTSPLCLLCNLQCESRNHLFFECPYTWSIWSVLFRRCGFQPERDWTRVLEQLQRQNRRSPIGILSLLCWQSCLYWSWSERNTRLHLNVFRSPDSLIKRIDRQIRDRILSLRSANPSSSSVMMQQWLS